MEQGALRGQVALVTGAGRGIGRAIAETLAAHGAAVAVGSRTDSDIAEVVAGIEGSGGRALGLHLDVTDPDSVAAAVAATEDGLGSPTLLVNNAGTFGSVGPLWESDPDEWWRDIESHVKGTYLCSRVVLQRMVASRSGRIVNVLGLLGQTGEPHATAYAGAKAALFRLTECLAAEVKDYGITVLSMSPGAVRTQMTVPLAEGDEGKRWLPGFAELGEDDWCPSDLGAELIARFARGDADALSGRFIHATQSLDDLLASADGNTLESKGLMRVLVDLE